LLQEILGLSVLGCLLLRFAAPRSVPPFAFSRLGVALLLSCAFSVRNEFRFIPCSHLSGKHSFEPGELIEISVTPSGFLYYTSRTAQLKTLFPTLISDYLQN